jgi:hypothetical protein
MQAAGITKLFIAKFELKVRQKCAKLHLENIKT